jgi:hypothetical protein
MRAMNKAKSEGGVAAAGGEAEDGAASGDCEETAGPGVSDSVEVFSDGAAGSAVRSPTSPPDRAS